MEQDEILTRVKSVIKTTTMLVIGENDHEKDLSDELDSLDDVEIIMGLEDEFNLEIRDDEWEDVFQSRPFTIVAVAEFIKNKLS